MPVIPFGGAFIQSPQEMAQASLENQQSINAMYGNFQNFADMQAGKMLQAHLQADGTFDMDGFAHDVTSNKVTAPFAREILQNTAAANTAQIGTISAGQALKAAQVQRIQTMDATVDRNAPDAGAQLTEIHRQLVDTGQVSAPVMGDYIGNHPDTARLIAEGTVAQGNEASRAMNIGTVGSVETGAGTQATTTRIGPGGATVDKAEGGAAFIPKQLSPAEASQTVPFVDQSTGRELAVPKGALYDPTTGGFKPNVKAEDGTPITDANGVLVTGLSPGATTDQQTMGVAAAQGENQLSADTDRNSQSLASIKALRQDLEQIDQGTLKAGPASDAMAHLGEMLRQIGVPESWIEQNLKPGDVRAAEKAIAMLASQQGQRIGLSNTDMQSQQALLQVPGISTTPEGRAKMFSIIEGNEAMQYAKIKAWDKIAAADANNPDRKVRDWFKFQREFGQNLPASMFQYRFMTPADKAATERNLRASGLWATWKANYDNLAKQGLLSP